MGGLRGGAHRAGFNSGFPCPIAPPSASSSLCVSANSVHERETPPPARPRPIPWLMNQPPMVLTDASLTCTVASRWHGTTEAEIPHVGLHQQALSLGGGGGGERIAATPPRSSAPIRILVRPSVHRPSCPPPPRARTTPLSEQQSVLFASFVLVSQGVSPPPPCPNTGLSKHGAPVFWRLCLFQPGFESFQRNPL